jgi:hypothetical protein
MIAHPHAGVMTALFPGQFGFKAGSSWSGGATVNVAHLIVGVSGTDTTFDFAPGSGAATFFVRPNGDDARCNGQTNADLATNTAPDCAFKTIQHAVDVALAGDTINVGAGTFTEQVSVAKSLTLTGVGAGSTTIAAPGTLTTDADGKKNIVEFRGAITNTMSGFTVSGPGPGGCGSIDTGIAVLGGGTLNLSAATVKDIRDQPFSGCQNGEGIRAGTPRYASTGSVGHLTVTSVTVSGFQKNGIVLAGTGTDGTIRDSTVTGAGPTPTIAQNGIEVVSGATGTVDHNTVSGFECNNGACGADPINQDAATGMLIQDAGTGLSIKNNTVTSSDIGINVSGAGTILDTNTITGNRYEGLFLGQGATTATNNTVTGGNIAVEIVTFSGDTANAAATLNGNAISGAGTGIKIEIQSGAAKTPTLGGTCNLITGNSTAGLSNTTAFAVAFTDNWWGSQTGPTNAANVGGTGQAIIGAVTFSPWSGNTGCTVQYGIPTKLVVTTQPANAAALSPFGTQPVVQAQDAAGNLGINFTGAVTAAIGTNPAGGVLSGTNPVNATAGVASFTNLAIDKPGNGDTLAFSAAGLTGTASNPFNVSVPAPTITAISPAVGGTGGKNIVTITGTNFVSGVTVTFGGTAGTDVTVVNSTTLTVAVPAHAAGKVDVQVSNGSVPGTILAQGYEYQAPAPAPDTSGRASGSQGVQGVPNSAPSPRSGTPTPPTGR